MSDNMVKVAKCDKIVAKTDGAFEMIKKGLIGVGVFGVVTFLGWGISQIPLVRRGISKLVTGCHKLRALFEWGVSELVKVVSKKLMSDLFGWGVSELVKVGVMKLMKAPGMENCYIYRDV